MFVAGDRADEGIVAEAAEIAGETFEIRLAHFLVGEGQDMVVEPCGADVRDRFDVERPHQVDTGHARAARLTAGDDGERHGEDAAPIAARGQWSGRPPRKIAEPMRSARHGFGSSASRHLCGPNLIGGGKTEKTDVPVQEIGVGGADRCQRPYGTARGGRRARPPSPPWLLWRPRRLSRLPPRLSSRLPARLSPGSPRLPA